MRKILNRITIQPSINSCMKLKQKIQKQNSKLFVIQAKSQILFLNNPHFLHFFTIIERIKRKKALIYFDSNAC